MAVFMHTMGTALSLKNDVTPNDGGKAYFYEPGTTTSKPTYTTAAQTTANTDPVVFNSAGRASIYFEGDADLKITDSADVTIFTQPNVNPSTNSTVLAVSADKTLDSTHITNFIEASGAITLTLTAAATLGKGWYVHVKNAGTAIVTIARAAAANSIDGVAANITIAAGHSRLIIVNAGETGFMTVPGISGNTAVSMTYFTVGIGPHYIQNLGLTAVVATKELTIALKTRALADAASADPVQFSFRNATLTAGDYSVVSATAATSIKVPSGATLGFAAAEDGLIYVYAINNAGTIELAIAKGAFFDESIVHTTTVLDAASDSNIVLYSTTARTGVAIRLIGRIRITTGAVAGEWDNEDTRIETWTPSMKKTGDVVQRVTTQIGALATGTGTIPLDDTIPQSGEGDQYMSLVITPKSTINKLGVDVTFTGGGSVASFIITALFQDAGADAVAAVVAVIPAVDNTANMSFTHHVMAGTVSATTFKVRAGLHTAGTTTFNGRAGARLFGGVMASSMTITEIQA